MTLLASTSSYIRPGFVLSAAHIGFVMDIQGDTKKRELLKNPTKIEEIQEKKIIDRN